MARHIAPLFTGPLDIVGDIHGEIDALDALTDVLGYDDGVHPDGRRLVFLGDLCDRGPDSPAVIERVQRLVSRGLAQCVLGNHELNLLRNASKEGNRWFIDPDHSEQRGDFAASRPAPVAKRQEWAAFFLTLPLALERDDLRVTHAAWHTPSIAALREAGDQTSLEVFNAYVKRSRADFEAQGLGALAEAERAAHLEALFDKHRPVPLLRHVGRKDEHFQMSNPLRIITSGIERVTDTPFWAGGKWRMCDRVRWWNEYEDDVPVIIGHYWRLVGGTRSDDPKPASVSDGKPDMFDGARYDAWQGARDNVYCVDFSVGGRYRERARKIDPFATHLAAVRWPEAEVVFDDGHQSPLVKRPV